jgi:hypothetical protein
LGITLGNTMGKTVGSAWEESWTKLWVRRPHIGTFYGPILPSVKQSFPKIRSHWDIHHPVYFGQIKFWKLFHDLILHVFYFFNTQ